MTNTTATTYDPFELTVLPDGRTEVTVSPTKEFDYSMVSSEQAKVLRTVSAKVSALAGVAGESFLKMGEEFVAARQSLKDKEQAFVAWCESDECPVSRQTVYRLMTLYDKQSMSGKFPRAGKIGIRVMSEILSITDSDVQAALLEHVESQVASGEAVTTREVEALKKDLARTKTEAMAQGDQVVSLTVELARLKQERDELRETKERFANDLIRADKERKARQVEMDRASKALAAQLRDAEEVYRDQLAEARATIRREEAARPKTSKEEEAQKVRLANSQAKLDELQRSIARTEAARRELDAKMEADRRQFALRDQILGDFALSSRKYFDAATAMAGVARALSQIPITDAIYQQVRALEALTEATLQALKSATMVEGND